MLLLPLGKKVSALRKFEMAMKQPTFSSLHFKYSSSDQDKPSQSTSGENTDTGSRRFLTLVGPRQHIMFRFNETTD